MQLIIDRAQLLKPLAHVQSVVERRTTIPILSNVLIDARDGKVSVTATDMDIDIVEAVDAEVGRAGSVTCPAHTLHDIVRKLAEGSQVELSATGESGRMILKAGRSTFTLPTLPTEEFPALSGDGLAHSFELPAGELRSLVDRTRFAISTEETRYYLNGIYLHATRSNDVSVMRAVATDGHRLARVEMPLPEGANGMPGVIVPRKAVGELRKLVDETSDAVGISLSETKIRFAFDGIVLTSKLIDGTFPDYERVIPTGNDKVLQVDCKDFAEAVDRVATISTEKSRAVKLQLSTGSLTLSASSPENGTATEEIEVKYSASPMEIGFNSRYLLDITQQIEGDVAQFTMADAASPTVVRDLADQSALYVLMPMRV
ncbi:MAG: DNA polymerase III subunit beta [Proteobacteria bacterium]|nr:DNA polymerase III subunit beta [Pseudomonadota bacterium]MBI3498993.1 DNA polymerase III subunit beta [Pseudomonadota bacterium]